MKRETVNKIPNAISFARILLCIAMIICFQYKHYFFAGVFYIIAAVSDVIDGYIARRYDAKSRIGILLDPLSDKILHVSVMICFYVIGIIPHVIAVLFTIKELIQIAGAGIVIRTGADMSADIFGKVATFLQFIGVLFAFSYLSANRLLPYQILIMIALVSSYVSLIHYARIILARKTY